MKYTVAEPEPWKRVLEIEVPATQIQEEIDTAYGTYRKEIRLPGFRKGKVPLDVLRARFGAEIKAEVLQRMVPELYEKAREESKIDPISQPVIEDFDFEEGEDLHFKAVVEIKPPLELNEYKEIQVTKKSSNISDEDINQALDRLLDRYADFVQVDGAAEQNHYVSADIQTLDNTGVPIIGEKKDGQFFEIGNGRFGEEFDNQLVGVKAKDERKISFSYPDDFEDDALAGQEAHLLVTVNDVLDKKRPELNDDFAKDVGSESLETLKESIQNDMEQEPEREVQAQLVKHLVESNTFDVPESMIKNYLDRMVSDAKRGAQQAPMDEEELRQQYRPMAIEQIKRYLIIEEIAELEDIQITEEDLDKRMELMAQRSNLQLDQIRRLFHETGRMEGVESEIREEKVIEFLVQHADIKVE